MNITFFAAIKYPVNSVSRILSGRDTNSTIRIFLYPEIRRGCVSASLYAPKVNSWGHSIIPGWEIRYVLDVNDAHSTYQIGYSVTTHSSNRITTFTPENILSPRDSLLFSRLELFLFMSLFPPYQNRLDSVDLLLMAFVTSKKTTLTSVLNRPMAVDLEYIGVPLVGKDKR